MLSYLRLLSVCCLSLNAVSPGFLKNLFYVLDPRGVLPNKEVGGGLGPHIKFGGKIWGKVRPSSPNKRKNLGSSVTTRRKSWGKVPIWGSYLKFRGQNLGYSSLIFLEAKFGAPTRISEANFGAKPPTRPPDMEVPPGCWILPPVHSYLG